AAQERQCKKGSLTTSRLQVEPLFHVLTFSSSTITGYAPHAHVHSDGPSEWSYPSPHSSFMGLSPCLLLLEKAIIGGSHSW
ncbi:Antho-RFamide neuropeptide, partial [Clarias magur]